MGMWLLLVANNAMEGTLQPYRPPFFRVWEAGDWAKDSWGQNDEFTPYPAPLGPSVAQRSHRRKVIVMAQVAG